MCDRHCRKEFFKFCDIASMMVEDDGEPHTTNLCRDGYNSSHKERKEPVVSGKRGRIMVCERSSRGKCSACLGANGFENKMWECHAAKKMYAKSLLSEAATAEKAG